MNEKKPILKRGYYLPEDLLEAWQQFHLPSRDYSPSVSGAFLVWMTLTAEQREKIRKAPYSMDIESAVKLTRELLANF